MLKRSDDLGYGFFLQDAGGGENSGVWVYYGSTTITPVTRGDEVTISATYIEYAPSKSDETLTELLIDDPADLSITSSGNSLPAAEVLTTSALTDAATAELWEGALVTVESVTVATSADSFGEWTIDDGVIVGDLMYEAVPAEGGSYTSITGPLYYHYGEYKISPRDADDLQGYSAPPCAADLCAEDLVAGDIVITELMFNPDHCSDSYCEWVEVYNATSGSVNLQNLTIEDDGGYNDVISDELVVAAGGYAVLAASDGTSWGYTDFTPDYYYGSIAFGNSSGDHAYLYYTDGATTTDVDTTANYGSSGISAGSSFSLDPSAMNATDNDDASNWCQASSEIGSTGDYGTPGADNDSCS